MQATEGAHGAECFPQHGQRSAGRSGAAIIASAVGAGGWLVGRALCAARSSHRSLPVCPKPCAGNKLSGLRATRDELPLAEGHGGGGRAGLKPVLLPVRTLLGFAALTTNLRPGSIYA